jgi:hypothetical protein
MVQFTHTPALHGSHYAIFYDQDTTNGVLEEAVEKPAAANLSRLASSLEELYS